jgi:hypothetical protein
MQTRKDEDGKSKGAPVLLNCIRDIDTACRSHEEIELD